MPEELRARQEKRGSSFFDHAELPAEALNPDRFIGSEMICGSLKGAELVASSAQRVSEPIGRANAISYMLAKSVTPEKSVEAEYEATARFRQAHNGIGDTRINNVGKEILKERGQIEVILRNWRIVFFAIAGVSLLIGGVGIFSVLQISISERLFEIGLRKSMGATDGSIFLQFLIESISLSVAGAALGLGLGFLAIQGISGFFPAGLPISNFGV
ncbi:MAG TPA: ABC transporter permease, partial [Thermoanaerobaculia bacterium]|nr:ABC transporter permease [Thermoanaerobaculia bacterium]